MRKLSFLIVLLVALCGIGQAQPSLCTITGTLYDSTGATCGNCRLTISKARVGSTPISQGSQAITANGSGAVSFTSVQGSFITLTGPFTIGRYNLTGGLEFYVPLQSSATLATLQTAEDALNALISSTTYAPANIPVITKTASSDLSNEFALGTLATGILKNTTTTGVPTIAVAGTDYLAPGGALGTPSSGVATNITGLPPTTGIVGWPANASGVLTNNGSGVLSWGAGGGGGGTWGSITGTLSAQTDLQSALDAKQSLDSDLTAIAGLSPLNDDVLQRKAGAWTNRTIAQLKTDFGLATIATSGSASDLGAGTVPDARFPSTLPALNGSNLTALNASNLASGTVPLARISGLTNAEIDNAAAIAYGKLNLTGAIVNGDLAGSIANNKLANSSITIAGSSTALGGSITGSTILDSIGSTRGSVLYRGASGWAILTPGTSGQVLTSNGAGADPSYQAAGGGIAIGTTTANGTAGRVLYTDGSFVQAYTVTGTGNAVLSASPTLTGTVDAAAATFSNTVSLTSTTAANNKITQGAAINIGTTSTDGIVLQNTTAAAAGAQQYSPRLRFRGSGWKTNATAAAQDIEYWIDARPIQGTSAPTSQLSFNVQTNGSGGEPIFVINDTNTNDGATFYYGRAWGSGATDIYNSVTYGINGAAYSFNGTPVFGNAQGSRFDVAVPIAFGTTVGGSPDIFLRRVGAANLALGAADAASPVAQTLSVQNVVGGTSNTAGANWTLAGSRGTGTGAGGDIIFQTAPAGGSGTSQNALAAAFTVKGDGAVQLKSVTFANLPTVANGYLIYCSDCTIASPCASGGSGAFAKGINGAWVCN
jgi:hypothetical protein